MNYIETPRYQRAVRKLLTMRPEQRALFNSAIADSAFGSEEMKKRLILMDLGAARENAKRKLDLGERRLNIQQGLFGRSSALEEKSDRITSALGLGNVMLAAHLGNKKIAQDKKLAGLYTKYASMVGGW